MPDGRTISELEAQGYDWIAGECCKGTVWVPFRIIRATMPTLSDMTLDEVGARLRCERCGGRPRHYSPARQSDAPGFARSF